MNPTHLIFLIIFLLLSLADLHYRVVPVVAWGWLERTEALGLESAPGCIGLGNSPGERDSVLIGSGKWAQVR